jgi:hypothetical protein
VEVLFDLGRAGVEEHPIIVAGKSHALHRRGKTTLSQTFDGEVQLQIRHKSFSYPY